MYKKQKEAGCKDLQACPYFVMVIPEDALFTFLYLVGAHTFERHFNRTYGAVGIKFQFIDTGNTMIAIGFF